MEQLAGGNRRLINTSSWPISIVLPPCQLWSSVVGDGVNSLGLSGADDCQTFTNSAEHVWLAELIKFRSTHHNEIELSFAPGTPS